MDVRETVTVLPDILLTPYVLYDIVSSSRLDDFGLAIAILEELVLYGRKCHFRIPGGDMLLKAIKLKYVLEQLRNNKRNVSFEIDKYFPLKKDEKAVMYRHFLLKLHTEEGLQVDFFRSDYEREFGVAFEKSMVEMTERLLLKIVPISEIIRQIPTGPCTERAKLDCLLDRPHVVDANGFGVQDIESVLSVYTRCWNGQPEPYSHDKSSPHIFRTFIRQDQEKAKQRSDSNTAKQSHCKRTDNGQVVGNFTEIGDNFTAIGDNFTESGDNFIRDDDKQIENGQVIERCKRMYAGNEHFDEIDTDTDIGPRQNCSEKHGKNESTPATSSIEIKTHGCETKVNLRSKPIKCSKYLFSTSKVEEKQVANEAECHKVLIKNPESETNYMHTSNEDIESNYEIHTEEDTCQKQGYVDECVKKECIRNSSLSSLETKSQFCEKKVDLRSRYSKRIKFTKNVNDILGSKQVVQLANEIERSRMSKYPNSKTNANKSDQQTQHQSVEVDMFYTKTKDKHSRSDQGSRVNCPQNDTRYPSADKYKGNPILKVGDSFKCRYRQGKNVKRYHKQRTKSCSKAAVGKHSNTMKRLEVISKNRYIDNSNSKLYWKNKSITSTDQIVLHPRKDTYSKSDKPPNSLNQVATFETSKKSVHKNAPSERCGNKVVAVEVLNQSVVETKSCENTKDGMPLSVSFVKECQSNERPTSQQSNIDTSPSDAAENIDVFSNFVSGTKTTHNDLSSDCLHGTIPGSGNTTADNVIAISDSENECKVSSETHATIPGSGNATADNVITISDNGSDCKAQHECTDITEIRTSQSLVWEQMSEYFIKEHGVDGETLSDLLMDCDSVIPPSVEASPKSLELDMFEEFTGYLDNKVQVLPDLSQFL